MTPGDAGAPRSCPGDAAPSGLRSCRQAGRVRVRIPAGHFKKAMCRTYSGTLRTVSSGAVGSRRWVNAAAAAGPPYSPPFSWGSTAGCSRAPSAGTPGGFSGTESGGSSALHSHNSAQQAHASGHAAAASTHCAGLSSHSASSGAGSTVSRARRMVSMTSIVRPWEHEPADVFLAISADPKSV